MLLMNMKRLLCGSTSKDRGPIPVRDNIQTAIEFVPKLKKGRARARHPGTAAVL